MRASATRPLLALITMLIAGSVPPAVQAQSSNPTVASPPLAPARECVTPVPQLRLALDTVRRRIPKTPRYTQGLVMHGGRLYESAGMYGYSGIHLLALEGGDSKPLARIDDRYFGEGLAVHEGHAWFLTWRAGKVFRYRLRYDGSLALTDDSPLAYEGEGWGLTTLGNRLLLSDGTSTLHVLDPTNLRSVREVQVRAGRRPLRSLNELEVVRDVVLANVYGNTAIAVINPVTGCVEQALDATPLARSIREDLPRGDDAICSSVGCTPADYVLNGIAWNEQTDELYLTGKNWPVIFVVANPLASLAD